MNEVVKERAGRIARRLQGAKSLAAFPITVLIPIITTLIQAVMQCWQPKDPAKTAEYVNAKWNEQTGEYDDQLLRRMKRQALLAGRHSEPRQHFTGEQCEEIALASLDEARTGDAAEIGRVAHAALTAKE